MCFKDKKRYHELESEKSVLTFHTTRYNVMIPIFISILVFVVEIYSVYYVAEESVDWLNILRLLNTTFIPTHIATTTVFLYQHFSLSNSFNNDREIQQIDNMEVKLEYAALTMVSTILLAFLYVLLSFKVNFGNQIFLIVMQFLYMFILLKYGIRDKIIIYKKPVKNVVSY